MVKTASRPSKTPPKRSKDVFEIFPPEIESSEPYGIEIPKPGALVPFQGEPQLWDQLEGESAFAYAGFLSYLNLGMSRTLLDAYRVYRDKPQATMVDGGWNRWRQTYKWALRASAYDTWYRNNNLRQQEELILSSMSRRTSRSAEMKDRMLDLAEVLIDKAEKMLAFPLEEISRATIQDGKTTIVTVKPLRWGIGDIGVLLGQAEKMRRLGLGMEETPGMLAAEQIIEQLAEAEGLTEEQKAQALVNLKNLGKEPKTGRSNGN